VIEDEKSRIGKLASIQSNPLYRPVLQKVTCRGFVFIEKQYLLHNPEEDTVPACTGIFTKTMGLPCRHVLQQQEAAGLSIQLSDIHRHWHVKRAPIGVDGQVEYNPIFDPLPARWLEGRRTARSGRILSGHEVVEQQACPRIQHCRACTNPRHNIQECPGCETSTHDARNCQNNSTMSATSSSIQALAPALVSGPVQMPMQPPVQVSGQYHGQWASTTPAGSPGQWNIPGGLYYGPGTQFTTQNWVPGPHVGPPGMQQVLYFPLSSQRGYVQMPGTQYSQFLQFSQFSQSQQ
jgi:hypothetical protein